MSNRSLSGNTFQDVFQAFVRHKRKSLVFFVTVVVGVASLPLSKISAALLR